MPCSPPARSCARGSVAMAEPPPALMSSTTRCASDASAPSPSRVTPMSLTTTCAPRAASATACARPSPPPAPVTTATWPSKRRTSAIASPCGRFTSSRPVCRRRSGSTTTLRQRLRRRSEQGDGSAPGGPNRSPRRCARCRRRRAGGSAGARATRATRRPSRRAPGARRDRSACPGRT